MLAGRAGLRPGGVRRRARAQVREYSKAEEAEQAEGASGHSLREEADGKRRQMEQWSASAYGEVRRARQRSDMLS